MSVKIIFNPLVQQNFLCINKIPRRALTNVWLGAINLRAFSEHI
ncbi:MAG: hypothetical protein WC584_02245 [Candidatus Pacearchaeota archaeon]